MQGSLKNLILNAEELIAMAPAQLAEYLLLDTIRREKRFTARQLANYVAMNYGQARALEVKEAAMEALQWLLSEALVIPDFEDTTGGNDYYRPSPRARKASSAKDIAELVRLRQILPKAFLHSVIVEHAVPIFLAGSYDTAVAEAFKQLEIVVRDATNLPLYGSDLMKEAFKANNAGLLTDTSVVQAEQLGLVNLLSGAMGIFRNPAAHRNLATDSQQAGSLLVFASHLISIAEQHIASARSAGRI
jgi:uncharacterized protein (TIGR02391 family)